MATMLQSLRGISYWSVH